MPLTTLLSMLSLSELKINRRASSRGRPSRRDFHSGLSIILAFSTATIRAKSAGWAFFNASDPLAKMEHIAGRSALTRSYHCFTVRAVIRPVPRPGLVPSLKSSVATTLFASRTDIPIQSSRPTVPTAIPIRAWRSGASGARPPSGVGVGLNIVATLLLFSAINALERFISGR